MLKYLKFLFFFIFYLPINYAYSQEINITADEFLVDKNDNYFFAKGNVITTFQGYTLYSDNIFYDKKSELVFIYGKIKLLNDFLIIGENLKIDLINKEGYIAKGELFYFSQDKKKQKFISGENIIFFDKNLYYLSKGSISSCEGDKKDWYINAQDINIFYGDYLTAYNVSLVAGELPLLYFPFFVAPIKKEKESGFLIPSGGYSRKNGLLINLPYYFFLDESYDDTLTLKIRTKNTYGLDNEFRYKLSKKDEGILNLSIYDNYDLNKKYAYATFKHKKENYFKVDLNLLNRKDFFYLYSDETSSTSLPYLRSSAFYEINSYRSTYSISIFKGYDLMLGGPDYFSLNLNKKSYPIPYKRDLFYNFDASLSFFNRGNDHLARLNISPYSIYRKTIDKYDLFFKMSGNINHYKTEADTEQNSVYLIFNAFSQSYKQFAINNYYFNNLLKISYFLPYRVYDNQNIKNDPLDYINKSKRLEFIFQQHSQKNSFEKLLSYLQIKQIIYFDNKYQNDTFSDLSFLLRVNYNTMDFGIISEYNFYKNNFSQLLLYNQYKNDYFTYNINYNKQNNFEFLNFEISKNFSQKINTGFNVRYDIKEKILKETGFNLEFLRNCYSIKFDLRNKKEPSEFLFFLYVNLYGLGEIKFE